LVSNRRYKNIEKFCKQHNFKNILEIGPGTQPFSLANNTIGCNEKINNYIELDIDIYSLPYTDNSIDFVYSRHTLEDIQNPDFVMREILRISNSGYIETPYPFNKKC
jgi:ubiquinone/menaquinone biosynthesis C-methylase UbiE